MYKIVRGLDLPITGSASGEIVEKRTDHVAVLGLDYVGLKPTMFVKQGDVVKKGQKIFEDKKTPGVFYTAPVSGTVLVVNRGAQRALLSVVIQRNDEAPIEFNKYEVDQLAGLSREAVTEQLLESGMWPSLRTRPYGKAPAIGSAPHSLFVTAIDSNPLAIDPAMVIAGGKADFIAGLTVLTKLTEGKSYVCKRAGSTIEVGDAPVEVAEFSGPHPSGLVGTHIHLLDPVNAKKTVWHINYQDVINIGKLFLTGELDATRVISVAGPKASKPEFIKTELGADLDELLKEQNIDSSIRVINGSVFGGRKVVDNTQYLAKFALQVSLLEEGDHKEFLGWIKPGSDKFTVTRTFLGGISKRLFNFTTTTNGSPRSMVPIGVYEKVMPLDILPTLLLKAIIVKDTDTAQRLGVLELEEEDLALCTFVCPSKYEYGAILRENLEKIEKDG